MSDATQHVAVVPALKFTPELGDKLAALVGVGVTLAQAAKISRIHPSTLGRWLARGRQGEPPFAEFADALEAAQAKYHAGLAREVSTASKKDWRAAAWILERSCDDYRRPGSDPNATHTTIAVLIRETGISREGIERAIQDGRIPVEALGTHPSGRHYIADHELAKQALLAGSDAIDTIGENVEPGGAPSAQSQVASMEQARIDRQRALADKAQLEVAERRGELVSRQDVQRMLDGALQSLSNGLLRMGPRLAPQLAQLTDQHAVRQLIDEEVRQALNDLADALEQTLGSPSDG